MNMDMTVEMAAVEARGNWRKFDSFSWWGGDDEWVRDDVGIVYTSNRDSGLLDLSNASVIAAALDPYVGIWCQAESHNHWACGHIDGYAILVVTYVPEWDLEVITPAFAVWFDLQQQMDSYPVLDSEDYASRELDALWENLKQELTHVLRNHEELKNVELADSLISDVIAWLDMNNPGALENCDDQGGYASEEQLVGALTGMGLFNTRCEYCGQLVRYRNPAELPFWWCDNSWQNIRAEHLSTCEWASTRGNKIA